MLQLVVSTEFKKDLKRVHKRGKNLQKLEEIVKKLQQLLPLETKYKDHVLKGNLKGKRDCHIEPDWILLYSITKTHVHLYRTGSHSDILN